MTAPRTVLFHRQYDRYSGGQQKVLDYFQHCMNHPHLDPYVSWGSHSVAIDETPWAKYSDRVRYNYVPEDYDLLFLAGMDWQDYLSIRTREQPVINLIQHVRHADPTANVYPFLTEEASRICVSQEVKAAIDATGMVNGSTFAIPNGIDTGYLSEFSKNQDPNSVYILGLKQPELAVGLSSALADRFRITCHTEHVSREEVLQSMATSEVSILLPHTTEGFFLPALEAMYLSKLVIVPDCVGNRSFCLSEVNCLMPEMGLDSLASAMMRANQMLRSSEIVTIQENARKTISQHTLEKEQQSFYEIVETLIGIH